MSEAELSTELEQQIWAYFELCAVHGKKPSILGYATHLQESYNEPA